MMKKETILYEGTPVDFSYDETLLGSDLSSFTASHVRVAFIEHSGNLLTLENQIRDGENQLVTRIIFHDPDGGPPEWMESRNVAFEVPSTKEEALNMIYVRIHDELRDIIRRSQKKTQAT